jgi:serine/threonine protein kinase
MQSARWMSVQESRYPWEQEALAHLRALLPDADPFRAWSNFEFIADDGSINEVDLLVISLHRVYLVEIKSGPGTVEGDAGTWTWTEGGRMRAVDNPLLLANRKAKKLKSLLARQSALNRLRVPYVQPIVFLSHKDVRCQLDDAARTGVYLRAEAARGAGPHIGQVLTGELDLGGYASVDPRIDHRLSRAISRALQQAGIRPTQSHRKVGDYILESLLNESDVYQDWEGHHVRFEKSKRRIRIYPDALESSETSRTERRQAAEREYRLLDGVVHSGILRVESFTEHERGPALIFEHPADAERLDFFLQQRGDRLDLRQRLLLVRQIAETLQHAHSRRLFHQALTPQSILVTDPASEHPGIKIFNWQAGRSELETTTGTRLTVGHIVKVGLAGEAQGVVYLAPELYSVGALDPSRLDIFSLGALAFHTIGGVPPATSVEDLHEKLKRGGGLRLSEAFDGASDHLQALIELATDPESSGRADLQSFLQLLDEELERLSEPQPGEFANPVDAEAGAELHGGFQVRRRLGRGSTAVALLAVREGREGVLKVALEQRMNERLLNEGVVLGELRHQNIVEFWETLKISGHTALWMAPAGTGDDQRGTYTLAQRIREEGRLTLDLLQRFGEELLSAVDYLEKKGISHRDIKPDNIGVGQTPNGTLTLVLFDFSLSGTPADNIRAGTPPYLDPFLSLRRPPRWDPYAERFATAVTLYEMATGQLPGWGDGQSNPAVIEDDVALDVELFDAAVRDGLVSFFRKALARDYRLRFDNADEMVRAWHRTFLHIDEPRTITTDPDIADLEVALEGASEATPVAALPISARVLNALERMGVHTLGELLELPRIRLYRNKGIGQRTVRDVRRLAERAAAHFGKRSVSGGEGPPAEQDPSVDPRFWSIDLILARLVSRQADSDEAAVLRALLGLDRLTGRDLPWPAAQDVAEGLGHARDEVARIIERARVRWSKDSPGWIGPLRDDVARLLEKHGAIMTREELVSAILSARGSAAADGERERHAAAVLYAAVELESSREGARVILYRGHHRLFVVGTPHLSEGFGAMPAARARWAEALGAKADDLAAADPLFTADRALQELLGIQAPHGDPPLPGNRVRRLAVKASRGAALSSRFEIYPRDMPAARALKLGAGSLLGPRGLSAEAVQARVASRYPHAQPLPDRPRLDDLLDEAGLGLRWDPEQNCFRLPSARPGQIESSSLFTRRTTVTEPADDPALEEAWALEHRLERVLQQQRFLALTIAPPYHARAEAELSSRFGLSRVSLEAELLREMRGAAEALGVRWEKVRRADAADPQSRDWRNLQRLVHRAASALEARLVERTDPTLLIYPGLLARYGQLGVLDRVRDACARQETSGIVLLIPADAQAPMPMIDRAPLPVVHASDWARIPDAWLHNEHRGRAPAGAAGGS